jgi:ATP-dependent protease ClpP protease subunit
MKPAQKLTGSAICLLGIFLLTSCVSRPIIEYSGPITPEGVKQILDALDRDDHYSLRIRSLGGDGEASVALAQKIQERRIPVIIYDYCGSGCALIFIASPKKSVEPNTTLMFHWSLTSHADFLTKRLGADNAEVVKVRNLARREQQIYEKAGISKDLLQDSINSVEPICVSAEIQNGKLNYVGRSKLGYVVFSGEALSQYGFDDRINANLVDTASELEMIVPKHPEWGPVGFVPSLNAAKLAKIPNPIEECPLNNKAALQTMEQ